MVAASKPETRIGRAVSHIKAFVKDGALENLQTAFGGKEDPTAHNKAGRGIDLTSDPATIENLMRWHWGARRYVRERPREALRKWIEIDLEGSTEGDGKQLLERLKILRAKEVFREALEFQRQYGGSAIILLAGDSESADKPINPEALSAEDGQGLRGLRAVSSRYLQPDTTDMVEDVMDPDFGMPKFWKLSPRNGGSEVRIHRSRVLLWLGDYGVEREQPWEWGRSELESFLEPWLDYLSVSKSGVGVSHRLAEQRLFIQGLFELLKGGEVEAARKIMQEYATARSAFRMSILDAEDKIDDAKVSLAGWKDIADSAREQVSAASGMSQARFFGTVRQGLSDKDESGSERDDAVIAEYQEQMIRPQLERLIALLAAEQGIKEDAWTLRFRPLREETPNQRSERRKTESEADKAYVEMRAVDSNEVRERLRDDPDAPYPLEEGPLEEPEPPAPPVLPQPGVNQLPQPPANAGGNNAE